MADISPFQGVRYNPAKIGDLAGVICPPYDVISMEEQRVLHARDKHNFVRLEHGLTSGSDTPENNKYTRAAATLDRWLKQKVLKPEPSPALYVHDHHFQHGGKSFIRRGLIATVRLEEWNAGSIHPHETTLSRPRSDRMRLLQATRANLSPIWALYDDTGGQTAALLEAHTKGTPAIDLLTPEGERHVLWSIADEDVHRQVRAQFAGRSLYIADGHHRYETALAYQKERLSAGRGATGDGDFNHVMLTLVDFADQGLVILPVHRLIKGLAPPVMAQMKQRLGQYFELSPLPVDRLAFPAGDGLPVPARQDSVEGAMAVAGLEPGKLFLLTWNANLAKAVAGHHSKPSARLAAVVFHDTVVEGILGCKGVEDEEVVIDYTYDGRQAVEKVLKKEYQMAFLLEPVEASMIKAVGDAGDRMPGKTTYFHPKLPAGLVMRVIGE
ncbi:MAG: hypothetical protein HW414_1310 [Dehalococcoidia bacterium]|nr:hypothetical protein [Dehalococcoidia bacterium]